jgi:hypothetical protein
MFRSGRIGVALFILRMSLVGALSLRAYRAGPLIESRVWLVLVLLFIATGIAVGVLTAVACSLYCAAEIGFMLSAHICDGTVLILSVPMAIALALLGPGAYSLDARIFGRRVIVLPRDGNG